ncbi:uncharacterized protein si:ch211-130h14.4 [Pristis pectinata]|uniref:uncharacterized protein si:ch211-130h14.4 n=1 Tax=Pristis pectinata TaxID=685728 RepID=UPI00223D21CE|nr:uncharacterized protein si:ch211-130h14.4 [Pristis pectinata]
MPLKQRPLSPGATAVRKLAARHRCGCPSTTMCTHMKSSLPSLLDAYLPPQLKKQGDKGQQNNPQKDGGSGKHRRLPSSDEDEEDLKVKATRKALQEQHYLEIYKNVYRLCKALQLHYMDLLSKRVQKQRHEIKERDLRFQEKTEKRKMEHNSTRRLFGHQSECSQLHHDIKYLKSVPKSHYYMIVELQDQLVKNGILKNQEDYEEFWQLLKQSSRCLQFETKLQDTSSCALDDELERVGRFTQQCDLNISLPTR